MVYAVDLALDIMRRLDPEGAEPVMFQRDYGFFIASPDGFARVAHGLKINSGKYQTPEQKNELRKSKNIVIGRDNAKFRKPPIFEKSEIPYMDALTFGRRIDSSTEFSLDDLLKTAERLEGLPDDDKLRMVTTQSDDWGNLSVDAARVIDRKRYLRAMRKKEERIYAELETLEGCSDGEDVHSRNHRLQSAYSRIKLPDCAIVTPHLVVSFPRSGVLKFHRDAPESWRTTSTMAGSVLNYSSGSGDGFTSKASPYEAQVKINAYSWKFQEPSYFQKAHSPVLKRIGEELEVVSSTKGLFDFIGRLNHLHDRVCEKEITRSVSLKTIMNNVSRLHSGLQQ